MLSFLSRASLRWFPEHETLSFLEDSGGSYNGSGVAIETGGGREEEMKTSLITLLLTATVTFSSGCVATRKFTRNEVETSADSLYARIDSTNGELKETRDNVDRVNTRVTAVDGRVT